uniref:Uncharacterized protein n=1 Tax=Anopheles farauti TaxID=69004 RepID=A0A182QIK4_9DIPT
MEKPVNDQNHLYSKTYYDALRTNEAETARWTAYRQEHVELKENLRMYQKSPRADIMIPMGSKALLPGQLYHTGEVMVSHGCGYFSECSTEQAQLIADHRIRVADELLLKYERERTLYSDKLEVPLASEAFAGGNGGQEIIEEYDEEREKRWREDHRRRVRESKQREAKARAAERTAANEMSDSELFAKLEEMELLEELEHEMDQLELAPGEDDDDQLGRLMRGEISLKERKRTAHKQTERNSVELESVSNVQRDPVSGGVNQREDANPAVEPEVETTDDDGEGEGDDEDDDVTGEFLELLNETKNYTKKAKIKALRAKLEDVRQRLYQNSIDIVQKVDLYQMHDELEEALDFLLSSSEFEPSEDSTQSDLGPSQAADPKKVVQFAERDQIKLIQNRHQLPERGEAPRAKNTLFLPIVHSWREDSPNDRKCDEIYSPSDIYRQFLVQEMSSRGSPQSILKNNKSNRSNFHSPSETSAPVQPASRKEEVTIPLPDVLGEVVEHSSTSVPDAPGESSVAALPGWEKKKVSRFKQRRH